MRTSDLYFLITQMWLIASWFMDDFFSKIMMWIMAVLFLLGMMHMSRLEINQKFLELKRRTVKEKIEDTKFEALVDELTEIKKILKKR